MVKDLTVVKWNKGYYKLLETLQNKAGESMGNYFRSGQVIRYVKSIVAGTLVHVQK